MSSPRENKSSMVHNKTTKLPKPCQDVLDLLQQRSVNAYFEESGDTSAVKRSLNWAIYFYHRKEYKKAREALIKSGETLSQLNSTLSARISTMTTNTQNNIGGNLRMSTSEDDLKLSPEEKHLQGMTYLIYCT